jgi:hypothetical protein
MLAVILCGSSLRPPFTDGPLPLVKLAGDTGCGGIFVDGGCLLRQVTPLALKTVWAKMTLPALLAPLPDEKLSPGRRLPSLAAADDPDERLAAVALVRRLVESTRDVGIGTVVLDFGRAPISADEAVIRAHFARRELEEGEPGHRKLAAAVHERRTLGPGLFDASRASLDALVRLAELHDLKLAIRLAGSLWEAPSPREATDLLAEYAGGPVGVVWSPARLAVLGALGLALSSDRRETLRKAALLIDATDAVGLDHSLLPGLGEVDPADLKLDGALPLILSGPSDASDEEIRAAKNGLEPG